MIADKTQTGTHALVQRVKNQVSHSLDGASNRVITIPNLITFCRIILVPIFAVCIGLKFDILAVFLITICAISDFFDGYLARKFNLVTKIGRILDPIADRLMIFVILIMLVARDILPVWTLIAMFLREAMLFFLYGALILNHKQPVPVKFVGKVGTAGLLVSTPLMFFTKSNEISPLINNTLNHVLVVFAAIILVASLAIYWIAGIVYAIESSKILKELNSSNKVIAAAIMTVLIAAVLVAVIIVFVPNSTKLF